jgi:hypothetical protein
MGAEFHGVGGQITAIEGNTITLRTFRGENAKVAVISSTRITRDRSDAKLSDFKVGDTVFVRGEQGRDGVWSAEMLAERSGQPGQRGGMGMGGGGMRGAPVVPEDNGKTYIAGTVIKIDGTKLTVKKPDGADQVIEVDDDTSFRNERRESVTLADVKVGDMVRGRGEVKNGIFVPGQLTAGANRPRLTPPAGVPPAVAPPVPSAPASPAAPQNAPQAAPNSGNDTK